MNRMVNNNKRSAAMNAKMSGFNQEAFSNIQTIKAFGAITTYIEKLKNLQKDYISMRLDFQKMSMVTSFIMSIVGFLVSYSSYGWGIYRVWSGAITYGTMTLFSLPVRYFDGCIKFTDQHGSFCHQSDNLRRTSDGHFGNATGRLFLRR